MTEKFGRYELADQIGAGGMGQVYRAYDARLKRYVALKMIPDYAENWNLSQVFEREAQFLAQLEHPNIVPIYDFGVEGQRPYIVMRLLDNGSLRYHENRSLDEAAAVLHQLAGALDYAHSKGVIHRDIKPANILFDGFGNAYLTDFGLARDAQSLDIAEEEIVGSLYYITPEVLSGEPADYSVDIYALAMTLYEVVTGGRAYDTSDVAKLLISIHRDLPLPVAEHRPELPSTLDAVFRRGAAKNPADRYLTARAFAEAFDEARRYSEHTRLKVFLSYSTQSRETMVSLVKQIEDFGHVVWFDRELKSTGGQSWWNNILHQIRECDLFVFALTPDALASYPCRLEYTYAHDLNKRILPVMLAKFDPGVLPSPLAAVQFVDYTLPDGFLTLQRSIANLPVPKSMPDPLPEPPPVPVTELNKLAEQIDGALNDEDTQLLLVAKLEKYLDDAKNREGALFLLQRLREKSGLFAAVDRKIGRLLSE